MKFRNKFILVTLASVTTLILTGCTTTNTPTPQPTTTASSETKTIAGEVVVCDENGPWGDVIAKEVVVDDFGEYCAVTIDPKSDTASYDVSKVDLPTLIGSGFTEEDTVEALKTSLKVFVETTLDSTRLDSYEQTEKEFFDEHKNVISDEQRPVFNEYIKANNLLESGFTITNVLPEPLKRDGGPRAKEINISLNRIHAEQWDNLDAPVLNVRFDFSVTYDVSNKQIVDTSVRNDKTLTVDALKMSNPELFEDNGGGLTLQGVYVYVYDAGNVKQISSLGTQWKLTTADGLYTLAEK